MTGPWLKAALFCLAAGLAWGFYKEFSDTRGGDPDRERRSYNPARAVLLGLAGGAACLAGLIILTRLGLTELGRF